MPTSSDIKCAIVFGATGAVGKELCAHLLEVGATVYAVVRRKSMSFPESIRQVVIPVQQSLEHSSLPWRDADVFVAIGTTNAKTPDKSVYFSIDHDIPVEVARMVSENGSRSLHVVSAMGANADSRIFYSATKGKMEQSVLAKCPHAYLYRPSLITGERDEKRIGEKVAKVFMALIRPITPAKYKGVSNIQIARRMIDVANKLPEKKLWDNVDIPQN